MSEPNGRGGAGRPGSAGRRVDGACDRFEADWRAGRAPRIEDYLAGARGDDRAALLRELLGLELELRRARGDRPSPAEYRARFPGHEATVEAAFHGASGEAGAPEPEPGAARNLLLGLLALQSNFVTREQLLAAFAAWVADKSRPLGQLLRDAGALTPARLTLLEALAAEHVRLHGDDPERSLAALSSVGSVRRDLEHVADPDLQASLALVSRDRRAEDPDGETASFFVGTATSNGQRFRVLRPHARGGLGAVFVALDEELHREVALKQILDRHADDPQSRQRFVVEAEITGGLEHPGIVPVYGLGTYADGRPYYAMRFIKGDSLKEAIGRFHADASLKSDPGARSLELRKLLRRFVDVCNAIDYAHSRGVLHRDIKPQNVIVGRYGETLVVDWGLAKPLGRRDPGAAADERTLVPPSASGSAETLPGAALGTPAYMSPEQAAGESDRLGTRSDVYSLGATLYSLLTGRAPFGGDDLFAVMRRVQAGDFPPPRAVDPTIDRALEAVCLKAMALDPEGRYATPKALAEDVERWMADEPVTAWPEPLARRARRWARRHRTAMTGSLVALLAGVVGLAAVAAVQTRANAMLNKANVELKEANAAKTSALAATDEAKKTAEKALGESEESRKRAQAVLSFLEEDVLAAARPKGQEGGLGIGVTVREAIDAAEPKVGGAFKDQPVVEAEVRATLARTYACVGEVFMAVSQFERAHDLLRTVLGPSHPDTLITRGNLATAYEKAGRYDDAIRIQEGTLKQLEAVLGPDSLETLLCRNALGAACHAAGHFKDAIRILEPALKRLEARFAPDHENVVTCCNNLANSWRAAGHIDEAIQLLEPTLVRAEAKLGPSDPLVLATRNNLALAYEKAGLIEKAIATIEPSLRAKEAVLGPSHPDLLQTRNNLAVAYEKAGRYEDAIALHEGTLKLRESLSPDHPDTLLSRLNLASAYKGAGRTTDAIELQQNTLRRLEAKLGADNPLTLTSRNNLAAAYRAAGRTAEAIKMWEEMLPTVVRRFGRDHPNTLTSMESLASAHESLGHWSEAESLRRDVVAGRRRSGKPDGLHLAGDLVGLARNLLRQAKLSEAEPLLRECLAIREKAVSDNWRRFHAMSLLGGALLGRSHYAEAELLVVTGYEGMKARETMIPAPERALLREVAERVVSLYEAWGKPEQSKAWKERLGLADLPADVFARP